MRVTIVPYVTGRPGDPYMGTPTGDRLERDLPGEMQRGDGLIHVVIDGYHAPVVDVREHDLDGASPFLRVRCRATRRSAGGEA